MGEIIKQELPHPQVSGKALRGLMDADGENRAIRSFLQMYGQQGMTTAKMRQHMIWSGWKNFWPDWVEKQESEGHLTKGGAQHWIRYLFSLEPAKTLLDQQPEKK